MIATLDNYAQSPRKVKLVTELVKGKSVVEALKALQFLPKKASEPIAKLLKSAVANAKDRGQETEGLKVKSIIVEGAGMAKRYMPRAMGRATIIRRKKTRVLLTLGK